MRTDFEVGEKIENRWEVEKIFHGGMGLVYVVTDLQTGERLAAKTYRDDRFAANPTLGSRFEKEALAWVKLRAHRNVVQAKYVQVIRNKPFLFLEYVPGGKLLERLPLTDLELVRRWAIDFCDGMIHVSSSGITAHRDIKPENCLIGVGDTLKISDFGLARAFDDLAVAPDLPHVLRISEWEPSTSELDECGTVDHVPRLCSMSMLLTRTGVAVGTPPYMAPEQFDDGKRVDVKADIYSFGVMLFQMITGRLPFPGRSVSEYRHFHQRIAPPKLSMNEAACRRWLTDHAYYRNYGIDLEREGMPQAFSEIVDRCLAKHPNQRYVGFKEVRLALAWTDLGDPSETYLPQPPPLQTARQLTEGELLSQALSYLELGRQNLALAAFDRLLERYPRNKRGYLEKGKLLMTIPHRYEEGWAILKQAESIGDLPYTLLDVETHLPEILDSILEKLLKVFEQADRAFVIFREKKSKRLVVKASRTRWPQGEDTTRDFLSDEGHIIQISACLEFRTYEPIRNAGAVLEFPFVICVPLCDASGKAFGAIWLDGHDRRKKFTTEDHYLLQGMVSLDGEYSIPTWILPFIQGSSATMAPRVECHHERVCESPQGPVVAVSFRGFYPPGSLGNEHARQMRDYLAAVVAEAEPAAALLDLTALDYESGDALGGLALPLRKGATGCLPFCIVATGRTAEAVRPLVSPNWLLGVLGGKLFETRQEAVAYLAARLLESTP
jgi:serine/threonine protein kinase